jgi:thymidylate synthase
VVLYPEKLSFGWTKFRGAGQRDLHQLDKVSEVLRRKPDSRQAVIQLFDGSDIVGEHGDVPCTSTLQFMLRRDKLHMLTNMRSNDAFIGLPHDFFCFTMLQEIMARSLSVELGTYKHAVGSLHLYDVDIQTAKQFLGEGWQSTEAPMPPMPMATRGPASLRYYRPNPPSEQREHLKQVYWRTRTHIGLILFGYFRCFGASRTKKWTES